MLADQIHQFRKKADKWGQLAILQSNSIKGIQFSNQGWSKKLANITAYWLIGGIGMYIVLHGGDWSAEWWQRFVGLSLRKSELIVVMPVALLVLA